MTRMIIRIIASQLRNSKQIRRNVAFVVVVVSVAVGAVMRHYSLLLLHNWTFCGADMDAIASLWPLHSTRELQISCLVGGANFKNNLRNNELP